MAQSPKSGANSDDDTKKKYQMAVRSFDLYSDIELFDWLRWDLSDILAPPTGAGNIEPYRRAQTQDTIRELKAEANKRRKNKGAPWPW